MCNAAEIIELLEGRRDIAYDCTAGKRTVGLGFNMESYGARKVWMKEKIPEDFDKVFNREQKLSEESANKLFDRTWKWCEKKARERAYELELNYDAMPEWKRFILADIAYNTGSIKKWKKVLINKEPKDVLCEARRNPKDIMDSRVCKIATYYGFTNNVEECRAIGLEYSKYAS